MFVCVIAALASGTEKECSAADLQAPVSNANLLPQYSEFLGTGYNIITGDPDAADIDPGWKLSIFDPEWTIKHAQRQESNICSHRSTVSAISGGHSAQASLLTSNAISASVGGWGAKVAFTGSESVKTMNQSAWSESTRFEQATAFCEVAVYKLALTSSSKIGFTKEFDEMVRGLPTEKGKGSDDTLATFMITYGTHFTSDVTMGGKLTLRWTMTESSYDTLQEDATTNKYSVEVGYEGLFSATAGASTDKETEATKAVKKATSEKGVEERYQGGAPFEAGDLSKWAAGLKDKQAPVKKGLRQITELLTQLNFPGLDSKVQATAEEFCQRLCTPGGPHLDSPQCTISALDPVIISPKGWPIATGSEIYSVAWAPDGLSVSTTGASGYPYVRTWNVDPPSLASTLTRVVTEGVASVAYSPDGKHLAAGTDKIQIWDLATHEITLTLAGCGAAPGSPVPKGLAYSPDGKHLATDCLDKTVKIWDTATGTNTLTLTAADAVNSVAYSPDGKHLAAGSEDNTVKIWDTATGKLTLTLKTDAMNSVAYSPDGKHLASGGGKPSTVNIWDTTTGDKLRTLPTSKFGVNCVAYSPNGKHLASGGTDSRVQIWDTMTGQLESTLENKHKHNFFAYSPDGRYLASGGNDEFLSIDRV